METDRKASTVKEEGVKKTNAPPDMITVDTANKASGEVAEVAVTTSEATPTKSDNASQARTPKHANTARDGEDSDVSTTRKEEEEETLKLPHQHHESRQASSSWHSGPPPHVYGVGGGRYEPNSYDHHASFQHREHSSFSAPMQVSPGGGRYYQNGPSRSFGGYDSQQRFAQQGSEFPVGCNYQHQRGYMPVYSQQYSGSFDGGQRSRGGPPPSWGPPPYHGPPTHQGPPLHPGEQQLYSRVGHPPQHPNNNVNFSRAVSSSFDRSIKSGQEHQKSGNGTGGGHSPKFVKIQQQVHGPSGDCGSLSEDASWGALKHVHSVDEDEMRKRLTKRKTATSSSSSDLLVKDVASNSSSLTNSPTPEHQDTKKALPKHASSLDSLSSVASAQEPLDTRKMSKHASPNSSPAPSLELMKCPSGTSALLLPVHQRSLSHFSLSEIESKGTIKRESDDEERDDKEKFGSHDGPVAKKSRADESNKKSSPLSITCSPPVSPGASKRRNNMISKMHQPQAMYPLSKESPAFYDKPPVYSYSMDSAPHMPPRPDSYPNIPAQRPGSSASSTITPMNVDGSELRHPPAVGQMPSWEIHGQDSFGATSTGGGGQLMGSFSFQQDFQMLGPSASIDHGHPMPPGLPPQHMHMSQHTHPLESRNQSFEGGHYHGGFSRNDSMMSYEVQRHIPYDNQTRYQGSFPPHASSWGSSASYQQGYGAPPMHHQRMGYPMMMRNYSDDSGARTSPPPGSGMRVMPPNFPPPPEFHAPPSMVSKGGPQNTIMTSPYQPSPKIGPFGWSKEEDSRLTEIMKKYKNPRDWEPIAKEHNRGRTAKECHERWIRYLKPGVRKGQWTDHEDAIVMEVVTNSNEQPFTRWSDLAQRLPGRVGKQIRDRWVNHLNPSINHLPFSRDDDLLLWEGHKKLGKRWVEISTKHFNNSRSENHIKNRWYSASFKKFIANEFGPDAYSGGKTATSPKKDSPIKKKPLILNNSIRHSLEPEQMEAV